MDVRGGLIFPDILGPELLEHLFKARNVLNDKKASKSRETI